MTSLGDLGLTSSRPLQGAAADGAAGKGTMNAQEMAQLSKVEKAVEGIIKRLNAQAEERVLTAKVMNFHDLE